MQAKTEQKRGGGRWLRVFQVVGAAFMLLFGGAKANAFSLAGPNPGWQDHRLGYDNNFFIQNFGPMNIGEEYRWNVPTLYYGFTGDFLKYFGQKGVVEVEKAIKILNDLPAASKLNIDDYPMSSQRINQRAQALGLLDVKSEALSGMLNWMGLTDPTLFVFCLRSRWTTPGTTNYYVIRRNFDPVTWQPSSYINGELWTYSTILDDDGTGRSLLFPEPVDPLSFGGARRAPVSSLLLLTGGYWTTLTRDDVAALKYIYRPDNLHVENVPPNSSAAGTATTGGSGGGGPYDYPGGGTGGNTPFDYPRSFVFTNTTGITVTNAITANLLDPAIRGGLDKINFVRINFDGILGGFITATNVNYRENLQLSGRVVSQRVTRTITQPDIAFDAGDLQQGDGVQRVFSQFFTAPLWDNNTDINGLNLTINGSPANFGPGTIVPGLVLTYNTVGQLLWNQFPTDVPLDEGNGLLNQFFQWGSFDGSTNAPVVYPEGTSIQQLEAIILGR